MSTAARTAAVLIAALLLLPACGEEAPDTATDARGATGEGGVAGGAERQAPPLSLRLPVTELHEEAPLASIFTTRIMQERRGMESHVALAVWADGLLIWDAADPGEEEARYLKAQLDPADVQAALDRMAEQGVFLDPPLEEKYFGRSASFRTLVVAAGEDRRAQMHSWHELLESGEIRNVLSTNMLAGSPDSERYRQFLARWEAGKDALLGLAPDAGEPVEPDFSVESID